MTSKTVRLIIATLVTMTSWQNGDFSAVTDSEKELLSNYILHFLAHKADTTNFPATKLTEYTDKIDMAKTKILDYSDLKISRAHAEIVRSKFYLTAINSAFGTTNNIASIKKSV